MLGAFDRLRKSLAKTKDNLLGRIARAVGRRKLDDDLLDEIEEILVEADVGVATSTKLIARLQERARTEGVVEGDGVMALLREEITAILTRHNGQLFNPSDPRPVVWLIVGVNGVGKTTTIGKLATYFSHDAKRVMIAACDTFRAAAVDQVSIWAERSGVEIIKSQPGSDPAAVAFDAARAAEARGADLLLIDTAGRLHTKTNLMEELKKIRRVVEKALPQAAIYTHLIIDGSTGQNAISQVKVFTEAVGCDGIIVTKLDGTARGGVMIAVADELNVPVNFIGIGEGIDDLQPFNAVQFAEAMLGE